MDDFSQMFFRGWDVIGRTLIVGVLGYVGLVVILRASGKRTLSKMNAFDFVVTVALGSTLAALLLQANIALAEGLTALALLVGLQYVVTWLSVRSQTVRRLVKSDPVLLYYDGHFLPTMRQARVIQDEVYAAVRASGTLSMSQVRAVVLETDGTFSVLPASDQPPSALQNVQQRPPEAHVGGQ